MNIKEAADNLYSKKKISSEEYNTILNMEKNGSIKNSLKDFFTKPQVVKPWVRNTMTAAGSGLVGFGLGSELAQESKQNKNINESLKMLKEKTPQLKQYDDDQIKDYFEVVRTFSPKSSSNPLVAGSLVNKMLEYGGVDHKLIQDISNIKEDERFTIDKLKENAIKKIVGAKDK
jgi:hypothetical protein